MIETEPDPKPFPLFSLWAPPAPVAGLFQEVSCALRLPPRQSLSSSDHHPLIWIISRKIAACFWRAVCGSSDSLEDWLLACIFPCAHEGKQLKTIHTACRRNNYIACVVFVCLFVLFPKPATVIRKPRNSWLLWLNPSCGVLYSNEANTLWPCMTRPFFGLCVFFLSKRGGRELWYMLFFILISLTKSGGCDACESPGLAQCLYGADTLCWNLTVNDRWSAPSLVWPLAAPLLHAQSVQYGITRTLSTNNSLALLLSRRICRGPSFGKASFS